MKSLTQPSAAKLTNDRYYLENAQTLINWVKQLYSDLLDPDELALLDAFDRLHPDAQAVLIRMVMRTGQLFFFDQLNHYAEIRTEIEESMRVLDEIGFVQIDPEISSDELANLLNRSELLDLLNEGLTKKLPGSTQKHLLIERLKSDRSEVRPFSAWGIKGRSNLAKLRVEDLFIRLRLMFFGNLHQSWSEFVVTELGYQQYESVKLSSDSRAFQSRAEVDHYLELYQLQQALERDERTPLSLLATLRHFEAPTPWLRGRLHQLLFQVGKRLEKLSISDALEAYSYSNHPGSVIRTLRVLEKLVRPEQTVELCNIFERKLSRPIDQLHLSRVEQRALKAQGSKGLSSTLRTPEVFQVEVERGTLSVERAAAAALSSECRPVRYVENHLINGLFGLFFWTVIFAPVPGAFFNPFQSRPADLYRRQFVPLRAKQIDQLMTEFDGSAYRQRIQRTFAEKWGLSNALIYWPALTRDLIDLSLDLIPAAHLKALFNRMLSDIKNHRSGFPDLIAFDLEKQSYELIEVKGPGDRLQDNQRLWFDFFARTGIPASVCNLSWKEPT